MLLEFYTRFLVIIDCCFCVCSNAGVKTKHNEAKRSRIPKKHIFSIEKGSLEMIVTSINDICSLVSNKALMKHKVTFYFLENKNLHGILVCDFVG